MLTTRPMSNKVMATIFWDARGIITLIAFKRKEQSMVNIMPNYWIDSMMIWRKNDRIWAEKSSFPPRLGKGAHMFSLHGEISWIGLRITPSSILFSRFRLFLVSKLKKKNGLVERDLTPMMKSSHKQIAILRISTNLIFWKG